MFTDPVSGKTYIRTKDGQVLEVSKFISESISTTDSVVQNPIAGLCGSGNGKDLSPDKIRPVKRSCQLIIFSIELHWGCGVLQNCLRTWRCTLTQSRARSSSDKLKVSFLHDQIFDVEEQLKSLSMRLQIGAWKCSRIRWLGRRTWGQRTGKYWKCSWGRTARPTSGPNRALSKVTPACDPTDLTDLRMLTCETVSEIGDHLEMYVDPLTGKMYLGERRNPGMEMWTDPDTGITYVKTADGMFAVSLFHALWLVQIS